MSGIVARMKGKAKRFYEMWKYGMDYHYQIPEEGITDTMGSHIYSFHHIGGGESARARLGGGFELDWTIDEDDEPTHEGTGVITMDKKSVDPSIWRDWYHPTRPPVINNGLSPHQFKPPWMQQQLVLYNRWQLQGVPPKPGNPFHMHDAPHKDNATDWYWPYATYDEFMSAMRKARYRRSKAGQRDAKKELDIKWRDAELNAPQV